MRQPRKTMLNKGRDLEIRLHKEVMFYPVMEVADLNERLCDSLLRCVEGWAVLDKAQKFENLEVVIQYPLKEPLFIRIKEATFISDILVPVAQALLNEVFWNQAGLDKYEPHHYITDLVFECITIYENGTVEVFLGS